MYGFEFRIDSCTWRKKKKKEFVDLMEINLCQGVTATAGAAARTGGLGAWLWRCRTAKLFLVLAKTLKQPLKTLIKRGN